MFTVSCPNCGATYNLDEAKVGPNGRKLKCAKCAHMWVAKAPGVEKAEEAPKVEGAMPAPHGAPEEGTSTPATGPETVVAEEKKETFEVHVDEVARARRLPLRNWLMGERKWLTGAVVLCVLGAGGGLWAILGPRDAPKVVSPVAEAPAPAGEIEQVVGEVEQRETVDAPQGVVLKTAQSSFVQDGGKVVFSVTGKVRNDGKAAVSLPRLQVELVDREGEVLSAWPADLGRIDLKAGEEAGWRADFVDPPVRRLAGWRAVFVE